MTSSTTSASHPAQQAAPEVISLLAAGRLLGLGRTTTYRLARAGQFPCRVLRIGGRYAVPVRGLRALLDHPSTDGTISRPASEEG
ncbi:helix-turn-helix domain-containing protein [Nonomuraea sp. 10N515B]|uniref:helix-turn-helix domain-containing protein n=1 Tax=Nonomuraea sp. 10N515B TaxID=3457422 RepID=UPI003FCE81BE